MVSGRFIDMPCSQHQLSRLIFINVVSNLGFANITRRPDGSIHSAFNEPDSTRSTRAATEPECHPFSTVQVQSSVYIAIGSFRDVSFCFLGLICLT